MIARVFPALAPDEIHVWSADLDSRNRSTEDQIETLSPDELRRADRFQFAVHRSRFIAARATLRKLLGDYLNLSPREIDFIYGERGKPSVRGSKLQFNVSHSQNMGLFAFTRLGPVGVYTEAVRVLPDMMRIATNFFAPSEVASLSALEPSVTTEAFFRCWTRKEAFIKATGDGLYRNLDSFSVSLGEDAMLLGAEDDWSLFHLTPGEGYVGCAAVRSHGCSVRLTVGGLE